jgi:hypothetical protein
MNTSHNADVVIKKTLVGWVVWMHDDIVASFNDRAALGHFIAGCSANKQSVYDAEMEQFLCGTVAQLMD